MNASSESQANATTDEKMPAVEANSEVSPMAENHVPESSEQQPEEAASIEAAEVEASSNEAPVESAPEPAEAAPSEESPEASADEAEEVEESHSPGTSSEEEAAHAEQAPEEADQAAEPSAEDQAAVEGGGSSETEAATEKVEQDAVGTADSQAGTESSEESALQVLKRTTKALETPEGKLEVVLEFMQQALVHEDKPDFKSFWEAKKICLPLFKECTQPLVRARHWQVYGHLGKEAKRLKDKIDEEAQFAVEQIEMAIAALEGDLKNLEQELEAAPATQLEVASATINEQWPQYDAVQCKINVLNQFAQRVNGLRKELMRTGMRIRIKNQFFQRLSAAGDLVFPPRKELVKTVSELFIEDVKGFIDAHFKGPTPNGALHELREEIKALQGIAKLLTLSTRTFNETRRQLSQCWDKVRGLEKDRRKVRQEKRAVFKENQQQVEESIQSIVEKYEAKELAPSQASRELDQIMQEMRRVELGRDEVKALKDKIAEIRAPMEAILDEEEAERKRKEQERQQQIREQLDTVQAKIDALFKEAEAKSVEEIEQQRDTLTSEIQELSVPKSDKQKLTRRLKPVRDVVLQKREQALLQLSDDDQQDLSQLRSLLEELQQRRREIKEQMEGTRKAKGASGFDFEKAMRLEQQLEDEKEQLRRCEEGIGEIEAKIRQLQDKASS